MRLTFQDSKHRCGTKPRKKLDVSRLKSVELQRQLEKKLDEVIEEQAETTHDVDETWTKLRDIIYQGALDVLGTTKRKHRDWFDENDTEAATVLRKMHESHLEWINDRDSAAKATTYRHYKQSAQARYIYIYIHCTHSTELEYIVTVPQYTARIHIHCTHSTQLEYIVTVSRVHS